MPFIKAKNKKMLTLLVLTVSFFSLAFTGIYAAMTMSGVVFAISAECPNCLEYIDELKTVLNEIGITEIHVRYLDSDPNAKEDLDNLRQKLGVSENLAGSITVNFDEKFHFEGYVSVSIITDFLVNHTDEFDTIVVFRDALSGPNRYKIMDKNGHITECEIKRSLDECAGKMDVTSLPLGSVLFLIVVSGLLDGINPCAFAVLLFFIALMFTVGTKISFEQPRKKVLLVGSVYIIAVFLAYLTIGLTIGRAITVFKFPHLVARVGAFLMIFIGAVNIKDHFWYGRWLSLGIPKTQWESIRKWMHKFTIPATFVVGLIAGLFEFPCTGGIYIAILGLIHAKGPTVAQGLVYLLIYNLAFVLPLIVILAFASNKRITKFSLIRWQQREQKIIKLVSGLVMVAFGVTLLFWNISKF